MTCLEMLLDHYGDECDVINDVKDEYHRTCLHAAVLGGHVDVMAVSGWWVGE